MIMNFLIKASKFFTEVLLNFLPKLVQILEVTGGTAYKESATDLLL